MNKQLLKHLSRISPEEEQFLNGDLALQKSLYTSLDAFIIESEKMLSQGKLIDMRPGTRFIHFPKHHHNYIEIVYMCSGSTLHIVNGRSIHLQTGDFLFLNQNASQEIMPAGEDDVSVNFMVLPEFFDRIFLMIQEDSALREFLIGTLKNGNSMVDYLHFSAHDILPIQNLAENLIWSLAYNRRSKNNINQTTMGLLFLELQNHTDKINQDSPDLYEQNTMFTSLQYIEEHYTNASLEELASLLHQPTYWVSKLIKKHSGYTFKNLVQRKRLNQAAYLLSNTTLPVEDIIAIVGYDNTSYFHRLFRELFLCTPKSYRRTHLKL